MAKMSEEEPKARKRERDSTRGADPEYKRRKRDINESDARILKNGCSITHELVRLGKIRNVAVNVSGNENEDIGDAPILNTAIE
jgi:hypothetical protein